MPLSEHEQRILAEIERRLLEEDPKFAHQVGSSFRAHLGRRLKLAVAKDYDLVDPSQQEDPLLPPPIHNYEGPVASLRENRTRPSLWRMWSTSFVWNPTMRVVGARLSVPPNGNPTSTTTFC